MEKQFLTAAWRQLIMANYAVEPAVLLPHLPAGTELDYWQGKCYVSLVGFMFRDTKVLGVKIPFHVHFEEVNLRFYVRYRAGGEWRRAVVFISETVPRAAIAFVANTLFNERYRCCPMKHRIEQTEDWLYTGYQWKHQGQWNSISVVADPQPVPIAAGSEEEFITEHYYGCSHSGKGGATGYRVQHPRWLVHPVRSYEIHCNFGGLYGAAFADLSGRKPDSVLLAAGSEVSVSKKQKLA